MADSQENKQKEQNDVSEKKFMIEKIKERPVNKKKLLRRTLITASMAVIFGLVACFTFRPDLPGIPRPAVPPPDTASY